MAPAEQRRRRQLAQIHILIKPTGLTDEKYRDLIERHFQCRSAAHLDEDQRLRLIAELRKLVPGDPMIKKINALLTYRRLPLTYAEGIAQQMYKQPLAELDTTQLRSIIAALRYDLKRKKPAPHT